MHFMKLVLVELGKLNHENKINGFRTNYRLPGK